MNKTHYRKAFKSPYLSSADIIGPTILTVKNVLLKIDETNKTKDCFNTAFFVEKELRPGEPLKPMILNACNSRIMRDFCDSHFIDDWNNVTVTIYVDRNVKFGRDTVEGLRISPQAPQPKKKELLPDTKAWDNAILAAKRDGNLGAVLERRTISKDNQSLIMEQSKL